MTWNFRVRLAVCCKMMMISEKCNDLISIKMRVVYVEAAAVPD